MSLSQESDINGLTAKIQMLQKEIETLKKMSALLVSGDTPQMFFFHLIRNILDLLGAGRGSLMLYKQADKTLSIVASEGIPVEIVEKTLVKVGEGVAGKVAQSGEPIVLVDALSVPIIWNDSFLGVINVRNKKNGSFNSSDLTPLMILSDQSAVVIHEFGERMVLDDAYFSMIITLAEAVDARDIYTFGHSKAVRDYSLGIGLKLGLPQADINRLDKGAILHDLGKVSIADSILLKQGKLTSDEYTIMKTHPSIGARIISPVKYFSDIVPIVLHHHERYDGSGYPDGLSGDDIPLEARILAIADAFDAMSSKRVYRPMLRTPDIIKNLRKGRAKQFDPSILDVFLKEFEIDKRIYRAGGYRLGDTLREEYNFYNMAVRDDRREVEKMLTRFSSIIFAWLDEVDRLAGPLIRERTVKKLNMFSIEHRLDFIITDKTLDADRLLPVSLVELMKRYQAYFDYLLTISSSALGSAISKRIIVAIEKELENETRLIFNKAVSLSRYKAA